MDFANRGTRPLNQQPHKQQPVSSEEPVKTPEPSMPKKSNEHEHSKFGKLSFLFVLFGGAIITIALIIILIFGGEATQNKEANLINTDEYQAVFLNSQDGQVYFGKLAVYNNDLFVLKDIYYVRVDSPIQPENASQQQQSNISLAKLGNELHGPQDFMFIRRDQVLYWENLKNDGKVVTAITEYKENGEQELPQQQTTQPTEQAQPQEEQPTEEVPTAPTTPETPTTPTPTEETPTEEPPATP